LVGLGHLCINITTFYEKLVKTDQIFIKIKILLKDLV
jgi:hypothetical protein